MEKTVRDQEREANRTIWAGHIERQRQSGKGVKAFCEEEGLKVWQFSYWRGVIHPAKTEPKGFVEVRVKSGGRVAIEVKGCRIEVERGFDPELLRQVVAAMRAA
jgi:hypothetical protein